MLPTNVPGTRAVFNLAASNDVPDTGHPMSKQGEHGHKEREHHCAVLRVTLQLLQQAQKPQQSNRLQQMNPKVLNTQIKCIET